MKHIIKGALFLLLLISFEMNAQTGNANFTLKSELVKVNGNDTNITSSIKRTGNVIRWIQHPNGPQHSELFKITTSSGDWDNDTNIGLVTYDLTIDEASYRLTLVGQTTGISATLASLEDLSETQYIFIIDSITRP